MRGHNYLGWLFVCYRYGPAPSAEIGGRRCARTHRNPDKLSIPVETVILAQSNFSWNGRAVGASLHQPQVLNPPFTKTFGERCSRLKALADFKGDMHGPRGRI